MFLSPSTQHVSSKEMETSLYVCLTGIFLCIQSPGRTLKLGLGGDVVPRHVVLLLFTRRLHRIPAKAKDTKLIDP